MFIERHTGFMVAKPQPLTVALSVISSHLFASGLGLTPAGPGGGFSGRFKQTIQSHGIKEPSESIGTFLFHSDFGVVWKTTMPAKETVVLHNTGQSYQLVNSKESGQRSHYSRVLGELMHGLTGDNLAYVRELFNVSSNPLYTNSPSKQIHLLLVPQRRLIKQVLQLIKLALPTPSSSLVTEQVNMSMLDSRQHWTHICSTKLEEFGDDPSAVSRCHELDAITVEESELLLAGRLIQ